MKCIKCDSETGVCDSRLRNEANIVWRRRKCKSCGHIFTTEEVITEGADTIIQETTALTATINQCIEDFKEKMRIRYRNNEGIEHKNYDK